ncbi:hypothetical protein Tco_1153941 [Tanacetum coccineum]
MAAIHDSPTPNPTINFRGCLIQPKPPQSGVRFGQPPYKGGCFGGQPPRRSRLGFGGDTTTSRGVDLFCYITHKEGLVLKFAPKRVRCFGISKSRRGAVWLGWTTGEGVRGWFGAATTLRSGSFHLQVRIGAYRMPICQSSSSSSELDATDQSSCNIKIPSPPLPSIPSPSLPVSPPLPVSSPVPVIFPSPPPSPIRLLGYRAAMIRLRAEAASTSHSLPLPPPFILSPTRSDAPSSGIPPPLPISGPTSSPPLLLPFASRREDRPEVTLPSRKRLGIALGPRYEVGESSSAAAARPARGIRADYGFIATMDREIKCDPERGVGYGITDSWDEIVETLQGAPVSTDTELGRHMTSFETRVRQDTDEIYTRLDDEQSQRQLLAGRLNMLFRDRRAHAYTRHLMETKARLSREAWRRLMNASDLAHGEVVSLRTTVLGQMSEIRELHAANRRRQAVTSEMLKADHRRSA